MIYKKTWKYILCKDNTCYLGKYLSYYRPKALKDFSDVTNGDLGGFIESYHNLSQKGDCWIYNYAKVNRNAIVSDNAKVYNNAVVTNNAKVFGNARVYDNTVISDNAKIFDDAQIFDNVRVLGNALIKNRNRIHGTLIIDYDI